MTSSPRYALRDAGLAYHAATGGVIAFGGVGRDMTGTTHPTDATWLWSDNTWRLLDPPVHPSARQNPLLVGDEAGDVLLFAGRTLLVPATRPLSSRSPGQPQAVLNLVTRVTHHADAWRWDGRTWQPLAWREHVGGVLTYDRTRRCPILVGTVGPPLDMRTGRATWVWTGERWTVLTPSVPQDNLVSLTDDPRSGHLIGFAGFNPVTPPRTHPPSGRPGRRGFARTWVLDDDQWRPAPDPFPEPVAGVVATDPATEDILAITARGHTWRRQPDRWELLSPHRTPPATEHEPGVQLTVVHTASGLLLLITYPSGATETWSWDGAHWHQTGRDLPT